jgi:hypothetical protein
MSDVQVAYTAPFGPLPEYVNLYFSDNGSNILTVRSQGSNETSKINLPPTELLKLGSAMVARATELLADED